MSNPPNPRVQCCIVLSSYHAILASTTNIQRFPLPKEKYKYFPSNKKGIKSLNTPMLVSKKQSKAPPLAAVQGLAAARPSVPTIPAG